MTLQRRNPNLYLGGRIHRRKLMGEGMGSVLLSRGGAGAGSSYPSVSDYMATTGRMVNEGRGLGGKVFEDKLHKLVVKPLHKKPQNIHFSL
jgi:hypothetical protein